MKNWALDAWAFIVLASVSMVGIAEADRAGTAVYAKQRTMAQYLASRTHASPDAIRADLRVGTWVDQFAQFEQAMLDGKLSRQHVDLLRRTVNIRVFTAMQRDQQMFIEFARDYEWKSFKATIKYWLMVNDQDGAVRFAHYTSCSPGAHNVALSGAALLAPAPKA